MGDWGAKIGGKITDWSQNNSFATYNLIFKANYHAGVKLLIDL